MSGFSVIQPGILTLPQDLGRFGQHRIGLTTGGPIDKEAMFLANRLLENTAGCSCLEISFGGLELEARLDTTLAYTGGDAPLSINGTDKASWRAHRIKRGARVNIGFATSFCRSYLAVLGGFQIEPQFGSTATVVREGVGGLHGEKLSKGDTLDCLEDLTVPLYQVDAHIQPQYQNKVIVRVIPGYQQQRFQALQQRRFYSGEYKVTERADRMGYRLEGPAIECDIEGILSEGICHGAIQIPADGQPIVLLNDRQTIGGYPKLGSALSIDTAKLGQLMPGASVSFEAIDEYTANNELQLQAYRLQNVNLTSGCDD